MKRLRDWIWRRALNWFHPATLMLTIDGRMIDDLESFDLMIANDLQSIPGWRTFGKVN